MTTQPEQQTTAPEAEAMADAWSFMPDEWKHQVVSDLTIYGQARAARAVEQERARVVAWLRGRAEMEPTSSMDDAVRQSALGIERGEHHA